MRRSPEFVSRHPCYTSKIAAARPRILTNERSTKTMSTELTENCRPILVYIHGIYTDVDQLEAAVVAIWSRSHERNALADSVRCAWCR